MKLIILILIFIVSCQSAPYVRLTHQDYPLGMLTKVVVSAIPGGARSVSTNRREISSAYFVPGQEDRSDADRAKRRHFVKVLILNEQRPYDLNVVVTIEEKIDGVYQEFDYDESLALKYLKAIKDKLAQSREDRNVIDDFRAF